MRILLHVCCGPCAVFPIGLLRDEGYSVRGYFVNPNIHPYQEFRRRLLAVRQLAEAMDFNLEVDSEYGLRSFLRQVVFQEETRCGLCYTMRLQVAAAKAKEQKADAFSTTLLYSRYQRHELIRKIGEETAVQEGIPFYYRDFRVGWQEGIDGAIAMGLYRQPYCGCIYSEQERYDKKMRKKS
jgi:predicted adenine nucleotide alpha hydrolase (AANH) superfamily ATPase